MCVPCTTDTSSELIYFALWNASNGTRWWPPNQDPPHLPPRPPPQANYGERRAGLCWPCPPGTQTLPGDPDLCLSTNKDVSTQLVYAQDSLILVQPTLGMIPSFKGRRLLSSMPSSTEMIICKKFASGPLCNQCNPGFEEKTENVADKMVECVMIKSQSSCSSQVQSILTVHLHPQGQSLQMEPKLIKMTSPPAAFSLASILQHHEGCGPGMAVTNSSFLLDNAPICAPCAKGKYSGYFGWGPCLKCPLSTTTMKEGSISAIQCVVPMEEDLPFVPIS